MGFLRRLRQYWPALLSAAAGLGALALLWIVRDQPLQPAPGVRVDALSAFFIFTALGGWALALAAAPGRMAGAWGRAAALGLLLVVAYVATPVLMIAGAYLLLALMASLSERDNRRAAGSRPVAIGSAVDDQQRSVLPRRRFRRSLSESARSLASALLSAPVLVSAVALLIGYGTLALRGVPRYDERAAGGALDGFVFWFVLLAACVAGAAPELRPVDEGRRTKDGEHLSRFTLHASRFTFHGSRFTAHVSGFTFHVSRFTWLEQELVRIAWLYPLVRLYSLGPWNTGWSFAAVLFGGAAALWAAGSAFAPLDAGARRRRALLSWLGLALAGLGLGTSAGIAAGCYALLVYVLLAVGKQAAYSRQSPVASRQPPAELLAAHRTGQLFPQIDIDWRWLLCGAIPLTAPFVAAWLLIGAGQAGGVSLLSGVVWIVTLLGALATGLSIDAGPASRAPRVAAAASVALGVGAPLVVLALIEPVVAQLQGGLTPYGDVNVWPWVGLGAIDSAHRQVTTLPAFAIAGLMLVLSALVYLIVRLRDAGVAPTGEDQTDAMPYDPARRLSALFGRVRGEVPWLGGFAPSAQDEERPIDGE